MRHTRIQGAINKYINNANIDNTIRTRNNSLGSLAYTYTKQWFDAHSYISSHRVGKCGDRGKDGSKGVSG